MEKVESRKKMLFTKTSHAKREHSKLLDGYEKALGLIDPTENR